VNFNLGSGIYEMKLMTAIFWFTLSASAAFAETVYLKPEEALKIAFKGSEKVVLEKKTMTPEQRAKAVKSAGGSIDKDDWNFYVGRTSGHVDGYALIDHEIGKMDPITFMTVISPEGSVRSVEILIYRESQGSEVHEPKFLKQYEGKSLSSPLRPGQDIQNISGATLSVRAVSIGVRRDLAVWNAIYGVL
jgi:Na+-translocating ferredoxin:NAD+ oxidoreductase RnfG subunit